ncbi:MAG TPA: DegT/DnrJ/EryC1/StrS family aminotransferase [Candidatus Methylomirabilis sp.]|nr:DegT/DnrJ/EryC1/StrS family aminotransferase [Candidatus Methylomirabilis sp.]
MHEPLKYVSKDYVVRGSLIDLSNADAAWDALDKRVRTSVRKGEGIGVTIRSFDGSAEELEAVRSFTPNDDDIPLRFEDRHHAYVAVAEESGERLGWILLAGVGPKLFMLCHASTPAGKERQTPNLLLWHAIKTWVGSTYRWFDVGGSYRPSLQKYFEGYRQAEYPLIMKPPELPIDLRITPFDTAAYGVSPGDPANGHNILADAFGTDEFTIFPRAMYAIAACLREYRDQGRLTADDEVLVSTTTETPYISAHVTRAIEAVCRWSQKPSDRTRAVFLIHEFGFPNSRAAEWRRFCDERQIPLIEDCAYGWGSEGVGTWGDVRIYSFTKLLPVQFGGALVGMKIPFERMWNVHQSSDLGKDNEILGLVAAHWQPLSEIRDARLRVWNRYTANLQSVLDPYFDIPSGVLPGAFIAKLNNEEEMKRVSAFVRRFGIEAGNWYHHAAIFLPCHQRMSDKHVDFVSGTVLANYREGCGIPHV